MSIFTNVLETRRPAERRLAPLYRVARTPERLAAIAPDTNAPTRLSEFTPAIPVVLPPRSPTIAPRGHERLIAVRNVRDEPVLVRGDATGREYRFGPMEEQDVPLADARLMVTEGDFAFSGGR